VQVLLTESQDAAAATDTAVMSASEARVTRRTAFTGNYSEGCQFLSSSLLLPSRHPVPAPQIRCHNFWRCINLYVCICMYVCLQCFDAVGWAAGRASGLYVKNWEWWGAGVVNCLERGADLRMA